MAPANPPRERVGPGPAGALLPVLLALGAPACRSLAGGAPDAEVDVDAWVRELADASAIREAIAERTAALDGTDGDARLHFELGQLHEALAGHEPGLSPDLHDQAVTEYDQARAHPAFEVEAARRMAPLLVELDREREALSVLEGLGLEDAPARAVYEARLQAGDLLEELGDPLGARERFYVASRLRPDPRDDTALGRIVRLHAARLDEAGEADAVVSGRPVRDWSRDLLDYSLEISAASRDEGEPPRPAEWAAAALEGRDRADVLEGVSLRSAGERAPTSTARRGLEAVMRRAHADEAFGGQATEALEGWVDVLAGERALSPPALERLPANWHEPARLELTALVEDPVPTMEELEHWVSAPRRRHTVSRAVRSLAQTRAREGATESAADVYAEALARRIAPGREQYLPGAPLAGRSDVELNTALDLAELLHEHRGELEDADARLDALLAEYADRDVFEELESGRKPEDVQRFHVVVGRIHGDRGRWQLDDWSAAPLHLQRAAELSPVPDPALNEELAVGLEERGHPLRAIDAYVAAERAYLERGDEREARRMFEAVCDLSRRACEELGREALEAARLVQSSVGWYVGLSGGITDRDDSSNSIRQDLSNRGHNVTVDYDDNRDGIKVFGGYRFAGPLALELGYTDVEGAETVVLARPPFQSGIEKDVADVHPLSGEGVSLTLLLHVLEGERFSTFAKAGWWWWDSDLDVEVVPGPGFGGGSADFSDSGSDPILGLGVHYRLKDGFGLRAEFERYFLDSEHLDFASIGIVLSL